MDDISVLEEINNSTLTTDLKLFRTRPAIEWKMANYRGFTGTSLFLAPNAPNGLILDYFAKAAGPVRITVTDKDGKPVRTLNARAEAGVVNRTTWDLRYDAPVPPANAATAGAGGGGRGAGGGGGRGGRGGGARGAGGGAPGEQPAPPAEAGGEIANEFGAEGGAGGPGGAGGGGGGGGRFGFGAGRGSLVDPGEYKVSLSAGGKTETATVTVEEDPRVQFSTSDREKRRQAVNALVAMTKDADAARRRAVAMNLALTSVTDSWKGNNAPSIPDTVKKSADDLLARVKKAAAVFENAGGGRGAGGAAAGPPPPYTPPPVTQKIARLMATIDGYSSAPTSRQMADLAEAQQQLKTGTAEVDKLWDEVPKLNQMMKDAGVGYFNVNVNTVPAPQPFGGRGGN
jgi:hypothetical protein